MNFNADTDSDRGAAPAPAGQLKRNITGRMLFFFILGDVLGA